MPRKGILSRLFRRSEPSSADWNDPAYRADAVTALRELDHDFPGAIDAVRKATAVDLVKKLSAGYNDASQMYWGGWSRSAGGKWSGSQSKAIGGRAWNHWATRQQARDIVEDSPHAYTLIHRDADTVVDSGLRLEPSPITGILGINGDEATEWSGTVSEAFNLWALSKKQHRSELFNLYEIQHHLELGQMRDNDVFVRLYYSNRSDLLNPLQFELIDPNQLRGDAITTTNVFIWKFPDGIDRDEQGRERKYRIWVLPPVGDNMAQYQSVDVPRIGEKSGRVMMIHAFKPEYAGQGRGYSQLGVTMQEFENIEDFILSQVKKAVAQSQLIGFVEPKTGPSSDPFEGLGMSPAGPSQTASFGATPVPTGIAVNGSTELGAPHQIVPIEEAALATPGGVFISNLLDGETIKMVDNTAPVVDFDKFVDGVIGPLVSAHGMSLEVYKMKFEASYSAARGALALYWRIVEMKRKWLDSNIISIVYEMWLAGEIAAGRISCPGWSDPRLRAAWCSHSLIGTPPIQIDPNKEAEAAMKYLQMSATNVNRVAREHNGSSFQNNAAINRAEFGNLPIPPWENKAANAAPVDIEDGEEEGMSEQISKAIR